MACCESKELEWSDEAGSLICTSCGSLEDPSQSVLTVPEYNINALGHASYNQWDHSKESRETKQLALLTQFISSLCISLSCSSVETRATHLFTRVKDAGIRKFSWGKRARAIAGACLYLALREAKLPCALYDLSNLLSQERSTSLVRCIFDVSSTLKLPFTPSDPSIHIPDLFNFLSNALTQKPPPLPEIIMKLLTSPTFSLRQASYTGEAITALLARHGSSHQLYSLPTPPTACACFILGIEAELRAILPNLGVVAEMLAKRVKVGKSIVMKRYKIIQDEVSSHIDRVPWLKSYNSKENGKRAKAGARTIVAKGIPDVLQFQEQIWKNKLVKTGGSTLQTLMDGDQDDTDSTETPPTPTQPLPVLLESREEIASPPRAKKRKTIHNKENRPMDDVTKFLLNPLEAHIPAIHDKHKLYPDSITHIPTPTQHNYNHSHNSAVPPPPLLLPSGSATSDFQANSAPSDYQPQRKHIRHVPLSFASYLLTAPATGSSTASGTDFAAFFKDAMKQPPTRLKLLAAQYGGIDAIPDDELFGEGEWEGMVRDENERGVVERVMKEKGDWTSDADEEEVAEPVVKVHRGRKRKQREGEPQPPKKSRINLDALAAFMKDETASIVGRSGSGSRSDDEEADDDYDSMLFGLQRFDSMSKTSASVRGLSGNEGGADGGETFSGGVPFSTDGDEEIIVDDWQPPSPVGSGSWDTDDWC